MKELVSIENAFIELFDITSPEYAKITPTLMRWALQADQKIGSPYSYKQEILLREVVDNQAELPSDVVYVKAIMVGDQQDKGIEAFYGTCSQYYTSDEIPYFGKSVVFNWYVDVQTYRPRSLFWKVYDNKIVFESQFNSEYITILVQLATIVLHYH